MINLAKETVKVVREFNEYEDDDDDNNNDGIISTYNEQTILKWYRIFKQEYCFANPSARRYDQRGMPSLFLNNPDLKLKFLEYARSKLDSLSTDVMLDWCMNTALPELVQIRKEEMRVDQNDNDVMNVQFTLNDLLIENGLRVLSPSSIYRWMRVLGFKYQPRKKYTM